MVPRCNIASKEMCIAKKKHTGGIADGCRGVALCNTTINISSSPSFNALPFQNANTLCLYDISFFCVNAKPVQSYTSCFKSLGGGKCVEVAGRVSQHRPANSLQFIQRSRSQNMLLQKPGGISSKTSSKCPTTMDRLHRCGSRSCWVCKQGGGRTKVALAVVGRKRSVIPSFLVECTQIATSHFVTK